ncbi:MAG: hypothetical protein ACO3P6_05035 [Pelagibacteraceae bacterium]
MSIQLMISALRQGKTGEQILSILDAITSDGCDNQPADEFVMPTLEHIEF